MTAEKEGGSDQGSAAARGPQGAPIPTAPIEIFDWMEARRKEGNVPDFLRGVEAISTTGVINEPDLMAHLKNLGRQEAIWTGVVDNLDQAAQRDDPQAVARNLLLVELLGMEEITEVTDFISQVRQKFGQPAVGLPTEEENERVGLLAEAKAKVLQEADDGGVPVEEAFRILAGQPEEPSELPASPESRRGDNQWWQMTQAEFLEKYPDPNTPPAQRAAFALLHRMMLEGKLLTYTESEAGYGEGIPEEVIAQYPDLKEQYEQAKVQVFEQPYEPVPHLSEEAKTKLENIFRQLTEAIGSGVDDSDKRRRLSEEAEDQITAILNRQNVRVPLSGIYRRLNDLPFSLEADFYSGDLKLAQKIFDQTTPDLRQVFAIGQEAVRVYDDSSPKYQAEHALNNLITRASGVSWASEKEAVSRARLDDSLRDNFYLGLTGKSYHSYIYNGPEADRKVPELEVLVQNFQGMNSAEVAYFQPANSTALAREGYIANLADRAGLRFIPTDTHGRWSLVEKIGHREISRLVQGKTERLKGIFAKLEAAQRQADDYSLPRKAMDRARGDAERLKLQLTKTLGLSGDESPVTEKTIQEMDILIFTSWENLEWFMQPGQTDYSTQLFAKALPQIREAFNMARIAYSADAEEGGYYNAQSALIDLIKRETGVEGVERKRDEELRQGAAYKSYLNKVLLPRSSTVPVDDMAEAFIDANILDNACLRLQHDIDQRLNNYFWNLIKEAGLPNPFPKQKRKGFFG